MENASGERFAAGEKLQWLAPNEEQLLSTENDSGEQWTTTTNGRAKSCRRRTTLIGFKWRRLGSGWLKMANSGGLCMGNDSGELLMENYTENKSGMASNGER